MITVEEQMEQMELVSRYAASLGLHGIILLSPQCPDCGMCHSFHMLSDLPDGATEELMQHWTETVLANPNGTMLKELRDQ